ncbi:hypothetical protein [Nocardioides perillae]|uniref:Uncharacterized protein n=1 Tax=Nocardioides perillae TaxID=1119534 RepID=A0A7Y9UVD6_9ACTN|nr:hypothetical protein [Nocardioides perillae]NYG56640.1 hypothetical protein [Nocardioides perillae]
MPHTRLHLLLGAVALLALRTRLALGHRVRDERGDVPGWVLITVMTAGLVGGIWGLAREELNAMLRSALSSVSGG